MYRVVVEGIALFLAGLLAGEEFVVRYGIRGPLAALDDQAHIRFRQGIIRTLRVLVPATALPALVLGVGVAVMDRGPFAVAGAALLLGWLLVTAFGTVPINSGALEWDPDAPPAGWKALIDRWERLNTVRTGLAGLAFACFVTAAAVRLPR
jgi:uncharacterized membrane protein